MKKIRAGNVTPGMRVYSKMLGEFFTVARAQRCGNSVILREGIFQMRCRVDQIVEVADDAAI